jgi:hypothetical protein
MAKLKPTGMSQHDLHEYLQEVKDYVGYRSRARDGVIGGGHTIVVGATTGVALSGVCRYNIDGVEYVATAQETVLQTGTTTGSKFGAWRFMLGKTGVLTNQRATATGTGTAMAYDSAEEAMLSFGQLARTADTVDVGYLVIDAASGGFTAGSDEPETSAGNVDEAWYYNVHVPYGDNGLTAAPSVGLSEGTTAEEFAFGDIYARVNGLNIEISAVTSQAFPEADVITTDTYYGGHLFVTSLDGSAIISLAATGIAGTAQTMDHATTVLATAALDAVELALPNVFTVIGRAVTKANKGSFAFITDDVAGIDGTPVWTDADVPASTVGLDL